MTDKPPKSKPWERQPEESEKAFAAFEIYLHMEPKDRNFLAAHRLFTGDKNTKKVNPWHRKFAKDYNWKERARAYDNRIANVRQSAIEDETAKRARWRVKNLEAFQNVGEALLLKGQNMLRFPLEETTTEDGKTIIKPTKWTTKDAAALIRVGKELMCIASDLASDKVDIRHKVPEYLKQVAEDYGVDIEEVKGTYAEVMEKIRVAKGGKAN